MQTSTPSPISILIINPNTTTAMTSALVPVIDSLNYHTTATVTYTYFTCPSTPTVPGIPSINSPEDAAKSAEASLPHLVPLVPKHDAFLVACYSAHPLVQMLTAECEKLVDGRRRFVTGIFDASVTAGLSIVNAAHKDAAFGIVSTGKVWEEALQEAWEDFIGAQKGAGSSPRFLGCETTGLNADQLHKLPAEEVRGKMKEATRRVVETARSKDVKVRAICLGCAGMVGLEEAVREALAEGLGVEDAGRVRVVDGVKAGVGELILLAKGGF